MKLQSASRILFIILLTFILFGVGTNIVRAQPIEQNETTTQLEEEGTRLVVKVSPFEPSVGTILLTLSPTIAVSGDPITDSIIMIRMEDETKEELYESYALNTPQNPLDYKTNFLLKKPGNWTIVISLKNKDETSVTFNMEISVKDRNIVGTKIGTIVWIVVSLIFFSGVGYIALRIRNSTAKLR